MTRVRDRYPRIPCVVPFCSCGATSFAPGEATEILCPKHYRLVDRWLKARRRAMRRAYIRAGLAESDRRWRMETRLWAMMKTQAITRAAGSPI